jgi:hypothetical protein
MEEPKALDTISAAQRDRVRTKCDDEGQIVLARRWGLDPDTLGRAALGHRVSRGTRAIITQWLDKETE